MIALKQCFSFFREGSFALTGRVIKCSKINFSHISTVEFYIMLLHMELDCMSWFIMEEAHSNFSKVASVHNDYPPQNE